MNKYLIEASEIFCCYFKGLSLFKTSAWNDFFGTY